MRQNPVSDRGQQRLRLAIAQSAQQAAGAGLEVGEDLRFGKPGRQGRLGAD
jgi:hypothetical protein